MANGNTMPSSSSSKFWRWLLAVVVVLLLGVAALFASAYYTGWPKALDFFGPGEPPSLSTEGPTGQGLLKGVEGTTKVEEAFTRFDALDLTKFNVTYPNGCDPAAVTEISKGLHYYVVPVQVSFGKFVESIKPYPGENIVVIYYASGGDSLLGLGGDGFPAPGFYGYPESYYSEWTALHNVNAEQMIPAYGTVIVLSTKKTESCMALVPENPTAGQTALLQNYMVDRPVLPEGWVLTPVCVNKDTLRNVSVSYMDTIKSVWVMSGNENEPFKELSLASVSADLATNGQISTLFADDDISPGAIAWIYLDSVLDFKNPDVVISGGNDNPGGGFNESACSEACADGKQCVSFDGDDAPTCKSSDEIAAQCVAVSPNHVPFVNDNTGGKTSYLCVPKELADLKLNLAAAYFDEVNNDLYLKFSNPLITTNELVATMRVDAWVSHEVSADPTEESFKSISGSVEVPNVGSDMIKVSLNDGSEKISLGDLVKVVAVGFDGAGIPNVDIKMLNTKGVVTVEKYVAATEDGDGEVSCGTAGPCSAAPGDRCAIVDGGTPTCFAATANPCGEGKVVSTGWDAPMVTGVYNVTCSEVAKYEITGVTVNDNTHVTATFNMDLPANVNSDQNDISVISADGSTTINSSGDVVVSGATMQVPLSVMMNSNSDYDLNVYAPAIGANPYVFRFSTPTFVYLINDVSVNDLSHLTVTLNQVVPAGFDQDDSRDVFVRPDSDPSGATDIQITTQTNGATIEMTLDRPLAFEYGTSYSLNIYAESLGSSPLLYGFNLPQ